MVVAHFLALDTVAVVIFWSLLAGRLTETPTTPLNLFLAGSGVWLVYVADRWLDSFAGSREHAPGPRHHFAAKHRKPILAIWLTVFFAASIGGLVYLSPRELLVGAVLVALAVTYLLIVQSIGFQQGSRASNFAKATTVAFLVAAAACLFPLLNGSKPLPFILLTYCGIAALFLPQTLATRHWEEDRRLPLWIPSCLIGVGILIAVILQALSFLLAASATALCLIIVDKIKVTDKVSMADWSLAAGGAIAWFSLLA